MRSIPLTKPSMLRSNHMLNLTRLASLCLSFLFAFSMIATVHAQTPTTGGTVGGPTPQTNGTLGSPTPAPATTVTTGETISNPLKYNSLEALLKGVLQSLITIGSILLTLALVWVGFKFVAARGNEEAISKARTALMWTVIGGLILLGATAIETVISSTVGSITV